MSIIAAYYCDETCAAQGEQVHHEIADIQLISVKNASKCIWYVRKWSHHGEGGVNLQNTVKIHIG